MLANIARLGSGYISNFGKKVGVEEERRGEERIKRRRCRDLLLGHQRSAAGHRK